MNPKLDRITLHGKGCDYDFAIPVSYLVGSRERARFIEEARTEWDGVNDWALSKNLESIKKYNAVKGEEHDEV